MTSIGMALNTTMAQFDPADTDSPVTDVIRAVAKHCGTEPNALRPIEEYVAGDAILRLFGGPEMSATGLNEGSLSFRYGDVFVRMTHDGLILVSDRVEADVLSAEDSLLAGPSAGSLRHGSSEDPLDTAAAAIVEAEEHVWAVASDASDERVVESLFAAVGSERVTDRHAAADSVLVYPDRSAGFSSLTRDVIAAYGVTASNPGFRRALNARSEGAPNVCENRHRSAAPRVIRQFGEQASGRVGPVLSGRTMVSER